MKLVIHRQASNACPAPANGTQCRLTHQRGRARSALNPMSMKNPHGITDIQDRVRRTACRVGVTSPGFIDDQQVATVFVTAH